MLVLLIVFMVTAPLLATGLRIDLPNVQAANTPVKDAKLVVSVTKDERLSPRRDRRHRRTSKSVLKTNARVQTEKELYIRADEQAHYGVVARAVAAARAAGVTSLNLLVNPEEERQVTVTATSNYSASEISSLARGRALGARSGGCCCSRAAAEPQLRADISDERARPMSVSITPIVDDAPLLKLGSKKQPGKLPDRWIAPRAVRALGCRRRSPPRTRWRRPKRSPPPRSPTPGKSHRHPKPSSPNRSICRSQAARRRSRAGVDGGRGGRRSQRRHRNRSAQGARHQLVQAPSSIAGSASSSPSEARSRSTCSRTCGASSRVSTSGPIAR